MSMTMMMMMMKMKCFERWRFPDKRVNKERVERCSGGQGARLRQGENHDDDNEKIIMTMIMMTMISGGKGWSGDQRKERQ